MIDQSVSPDTPSLATGVDPCLNRRALLVGVAATTLAACGAPSGRKAPVVNGEDIPEPPEIRSSNGVLDVTLEGAPARVTVAGRTFVSNVLNGRYIPPVLVVQRGDEAHIRFVNMIGKADIEIDGPQPSNIHTHGMAIPPVQPADNAYIGVPSGAPAAASASHSGAQMDHGFEPLRSFPDGSGYQSPNVYEYRWKVPADHAQGLHWYHPHAHGMVEPQVLSGMSGLLIVDGFIQDHYPELAQLKVRRLILKDIDLPGAADGAPKTKTINGVAGGVLRMRPGEHQVWEIGNVGADAFFDLEIQGQQVWAMGHDGNIVIEPSPATSVYLPAGARTTIVVKAAATVGAFAVNSLAVDTGPAGDPNPLVRLATLSIEGDPLDQGAITRRMAQPAANRASIQPTVEGVTALPTTRKRTIRFSESSDGKHFFIDGRAFDPARDDITVKLGDVEEWTLQNTTGELHVFHIHQLDFLVLDINDGDIDARGLRDTIDMPYARDGQPGQVRIKIPFTSPTMVGRFPFHCHILEHEDAGMMATVRVVA
jgi:suppressor of ftsI